MNKVTIGSGPSGPSAGYGWLSTALLYYSIQTIIMIRWTILVCAQKLTCSQLDLPHGTEQKRAMKKLKTNNGDAQKKQSGREVRGVSREAGRESMVGKICERGRS